MTPNKKTWIGPAQFLVALAAIGWLLAGCATADVNPKTAHANTGYVDLYTDPSGDVYWDVEQFDERSGEFQVLYSELESPMGGFLRLALAPGRHTLRLTFLNHVIVKPVEVEVSVEDGKITPVCVTLTEAGNVSVQSKYLSMGTSMRGPARLPVKQVSRDTTSYELSAKTAPATSYQPKDAMHYAH